MKDHVIEEAQNYLTVQYDDRTHQMVNVELLLHRHGPEAVLDFLIELQEQYRKNLRQLIRKNKNDPKINDLVAKRFRIRMAINVIKNSERREKAA